MARALPWLRPMVVATIVGLLAAMPAPAVATQADLNPNDDSPGATDLNPNDDTPGVVNYNPNVAAGQTAAPPADDAPPADRNGRERRDAADGDGGEGNAATAEQTAGGGADLRGAEVDEADTALASRAGDGNAGHASQSAGGNQGGGDDAAVGGGGVAGAGAAGGIVVTSAGITGNNRGNEINVDDCGVGSIQIDGGEITNLSDISVSADGGTAVGVASGGSDNVVQAGGAIASTVSVGNGGAAGASADGGIVITGALITGNNRGHEINVADCPGGRGDAVLVIDGGDLSNSTVIDISADGGTAIADASGGDGNLGISGGLGGDAAAGNGGVANASADGGIVVTSAIITGNNRGNTITVGGAAGDGSGGGGTSGGASCLGGPVSVLIDGGDVTNSTVIDISADGGTAIADASGGDGNLGITGGLGDIAAGNGGVANASADGGIVLAGPILTGNNRGNEITVGNVGGCPASPAPDAPKPHQEPKAPDGVTTVRPGRGAAGVTVVALPSTGAGTLAAGDAVASALLVGSWGILMLGLALARRRLGHRLAVVRTR